MIVSDGLIDQLLDDARSVMWHDADLDGAPWQHAQEHVGKKFRSTLRRYSKRSAQPAGDTADRAVTIANEIDAVITGQETAAVYLAIGMVLGAMAGKAERPDVCGLMEIISKVAHDQMARDLSAPAEPRRN